MIEPRCLIQDDGRPCLLRDDFAIGENGFIGPAWPPMRWRRSAGSKSEAPHAQAGLSFGEAGGGVASPSTTGAATVNSDLWQKRRFRALT